MGTRTFGSARQKERVCVQMCVWCCASGVKDTSLVHDVTRAMAQKGGSRTKSDGRQGGEQGQSGQHLDDDEPELGTLKASSWESGPGARRLCSW